MYEWEGTNSMLGPFWNSCGYVKFIKQQLPRGAAIFLFQWLDVPPVQLSNWFPAVHTALNELSLPGTSAHVNKWFYSRQAKSINLVLITFWGMNWKSLKYRKFILHLSSELVFFNHTKMKTEVDFLAEVIF